MNTYFLAIQSDYTTIEVALFNNNQRYLVKTVDKRFASKCIIPLCSELLHAQSLSLADLSFIAVNQGPGPFTTLRTVIASMNGISFATKLPLIGIDSLEAFAQEYHNADHPYTVILLNAFTQDVYYALDFAGQNIEMGCKPISLLLDEINQYIPDTKLIRFIGGGANLHRKYILEKFDSRSLIPKPVPESCSIEKIGSLALERWKKQEGLSQQLSPLYLKRITAKKIAN